MAEEFQALVDNNTWRLVPRPPRANIVTGKWIFKHKYNADGSLARHKARWVVRGFSQQYDVDYDETFSPVVKPATIRVVLSIATSRSWPIHQLDVKNAFLHGHLQDTVYCQQPPGFVDPSAPDHVCFLFLSQRQYAVELLQRAGMSECHPTTTPVDSKSKLSAADGPPIDDPAFYRSLAGALQYLTLTRPDLAYAVQQICLFMHDPREPHLALVKRILRYVKGTLPQGLHIGTGCSLTAYSDADWAGCPDSRRSTSGYCVFLGDTLVSWLQQKALLKLMDLQYKIQFKKGVTNTAAGALSRMPEQDTIYSISMIAADPRAPVLPIQVLDVQDIWLGGLLKYNKMLLLGTASNIKL
ncbi:uncharacterized protein LOC110435969 [Sorghum bicolor]|uniref:uncharacterized protein LOC110435969 n=1 Tax=Sorghum bicolor TaxID=4558 RepID=UPI000B42640A|nr:uncharacterized protein LOC110435969 [Sorghum bicolor]|eukprot:XP_021317764.1 uncharacterized protein LOC110435969 [Sorghum bicolor]